MSNRCSEVCLADAAKYIAKPKDGAKEGVEVSQHAEHLNVEAADVRGSSI